jgi:hypothetical protein
MALFIIIDDTRADSFSFGPPDWNINTLNPWFNGTGHVPPRNTSGQLSMTFNGQSFSLSLSQLNRSLVSGTSVAFFGITPPPNSSQILAVSIDGSPPTNTSYNDPNPPSYRQWYQSPTLSEGPHKISLSLLAGTSLDFAIVTAGNDTSLAEQVAIVDNEDSAITYQGNWSRNKASFNSSQIPDGLPFQNTTQDSSTIGDNLTFLFNGTLSLPTNPFVIGESNFFWWLGQSAAIYGVFNWSTLGLITLSFTLDGSSLSKTFQVTSTTTQFQSQLGQQPNFQFFSYNFLTPGNHTLVVNVTDCVNQTFSFDYMTFEPSFSTLAARPNLTSLTGHTHSSSAHSLSAGAIVAIVMITVVAVVSCLSFATRIWKRKRSKNSLRKPPCIPYPSPNSHF